MRKRKTRKGSENKFKRVKEIRKKRENVEEKRKEKNIKGERPGMYFNITLFSRDNMI